MFSLHVQIYMKLNIKFKKADFLDFRLIDLSLDYWNKVNLGNEGYGDLKQQQTHALSLHICSNSLC